jgi:hypothetical protein
LHFCVSSRGGDRRCRGRRGLRLLRAARQSKEQAGSKENDNRDEKCCGLFAPAFHSSSPDTAAPEK